MRFGRRLASLSLFLAVVTSGHQSAATVVNWNVATGGSWTNAANWNPAQVPGPNDDAVIGSVIATGQTVTLDADQTVYGFQVGPGSGKTVTLSAGTPSTSKLIVLSTDTSSNGSTTFFALSGNNGTNNSISAPIQLGNGATGSFAASFNSFVNASNFVLNGAITESPGQTWGVRIVGNGTGIVNYATTAKAYSGDTTIATNGILKLNTDNMIPDGIGKGNVVIEGSGQLQLNNVNETINGLNSTSTSALVTKSGSNSRSLTVGGGNANGSFAGIVTFAGGSSSISKTGSGAQTFSGPVTAPGSSTVNGGTLLVNSTSWGPAVTVASGGTLAGTGTITGGVTVQGGGKLSPGNSVGALSSGAQIESLDTGALTFNATSTFVYEVNSSNSPTAAADLVNVSGALTINSGALAILSDLAGAGGPSLGKLSLISYSGTWNGVIFSGMPDHSIVSVGTNQYVLNYNDTARGVNFGGGLYNNFVTLTAIPEASAAIFGALACCVSLIGLRFRRVVGQASVANLATDPVRDET